LTDSRRPPKFTPRPPPFRVSGPRTSLLRTVLSRVGAPRLRWTAVGGGVKRYFSARRLAGRH